MIERYTTAGMSNIWDEDKKYKYWLDVELAVCEANAKAGIIPSEILPNLKKKAQFDVSRIHDIEDEIQHDVIAFLTNVAEYVGDDSRWIHYGMTSSDLLDTAFALQLTDSGKIIMNQLERLSELLKNKAIQYKGLLTIGRTHGIHAEPTTYGLKFLNWYMEINRHITRWNEAIEGIRFGAISGAVGTYAHISPDIEKDVCKILNLETDPITTQVIQRDRHAHYMMVLSGIASTLEKISIEIRHLQRTEVLEVEEPFGKKQKGSSAMPHKKNPIVTERITGMARVLRGYAVTAMENVALWHERDISHSSAERIIFPDSLHLMDYMLEKIVYILGGMEIYEGHVKNNLNLTGGLHHSQRILLKLVNTGLTREDAYRKIQKLAMMSWESKTPLLELIKKDDDISSYLKDVDLDELFNDEHFLVNIDAIYKRCGLE